MTLHIYNCETAVVRSEMVKRTKPDGVFYGLRLHMNTDQTVTFWSKTRAGLLAMTDSLAHTAQTKPASDRPSVPGQMSVV